MTSRSLISGSMFASATSGGVAAEGPKKRRPQVKLACMNCRRQHAGCTDSRPCERCVRLGMAATCEDMPRKKRSRKKHLPDLDEDDHYGSAVSGTCLWCNIY